jgi:4-hydroxybenzoyl-CoA reductase subunit beta
MHLPPFDYYAPDTLSHALKLKSDLGSGASILAGGTDLVVNLKHRLLSPASVITLKKIKDIHEIQVKRDSIVIGAGATLAEIAKHEAVLEHFPILAKSIESIGAPAIQHYRGTLGGNLCLTPRCIMYNQSLFWRTSKGACHRTGGKDCLAQQGSESCQAICSGDTVPVLTALSAQLTVAGASGTRAMAISDFFTGKGESPFVLGPDEILTEIRLLLPWRPLSWSYQRLSARSAVDFPLINAACVATVDNGKVQGFRLVLSAAGPAPVILREVESAIKEQPPEPMAVDMAGEAAFKVAEGIIVDNASVSRDYRIKMARVVAGRAVKEALKL